MEIVCSETALIVVERGDGGAKLYEFRAGVPRDDLPAWAVQVLLRDERIREYVPEPEPLSDPDSLLEVLVEPLSRRRRSSAKPNEPDKPNEPASAEE